MGAYLPDLPGVVALGATRDEVSDRIREAVGAYAEEMGRARPAPSSGSLAVDALEIAPMFATSVPGLSAAGDVSSPMPPWPTRSPPARTPRPASSTA